MAFASFPDVLAALDEAPESLIGVPENDWLDFKSEPYRLDQDNQKIELAKDVTAMANRREGGLIVLGVRTEPNATTKVDVAVELRPFPSGLVDPKQMAEIIRSWAYPPLDVSIQCHAQSEGEIWSVLVVPKERDWPYLVSGELVNSGISRRFFAWYERSGSENRFYTPEYVQGYLRRGLINEAPQGQGTTSLLLDFDKELRDVAELFLKEDMVSAQLPEHEASLYLQALPASRVELENFFEGREPSLWNRMYRIAHLRPGGFNLPDGRTPERRLNGFRNVAPEKSVLSVSLNGITTTAVGEYILTWANEQYSSTPALNVIALTEYVLEFWRFFLSEVVSRGNGESDFVWHVGMVNLSNGREIKLPPARGRVFEDDLAAPVSPSFDSGWQVDSTFDAGKMAFKALKKIYGHFGLDAALAPGVDGTEVNQEDLLAR